MPKIDFGFGGSGNTEPQEPVTDLDAGKVIDDPTGQTTGLGDDKKPADNPADKPADNAEDNKPVDDGNKPADDKFGDLVAGTVISIGEESYTVDSEGNLVDKDNKILKKPQKLKIILLNLKLMRIKKLLLMLIRLSKLLVLKLLMRTINRLPLIILLRVLLNMLMKLLNYRSKKLLKLEFKLFLTNILLLLTF